MSGIVALFINLLVGAVGGNLAGAAMKAKSLGLLWNSVVGVLGGAIGFFRTRHAWNRRRRHHLANSCSLYRRRGFAVCCQSHSQEFVKDAQKAFAN